MRNLYSCVKVAEDFVSPEVRSLQETAHFVVVRLSVLSHVLGDVIATLRVQRYQRSNGVFCLIS